MTRLGRKTSRAWRWGAKRAGWVEQRGVRAVRKVERWCELDWGLGEEEEEEPLEVEVEDPRGGEERDWESWWTESSIG